MKKTMLSSNPHQKGRKTKVEFRKGGLIITAVIAIILGLVSILGILGYAVKNSSEYNKMHQIARDVAEDPNSHSDVEILNSGDALVKMMNETVQGGTTGAGGGLTGGGHGVKLILQAEEALRKVRIQAYVIKIVPSPASPVAGQAVTVAITIVNSIQGTEVNYSLVGSDGYTQNDTLATDQNGQVSFSVPGGEGGVTDVITVTVGSVSEVYTYKFHGDTTKTMKQYRMR